MRRQEAGFTLIEVMLASVILACGLVVIVRGMAATLSGARHAGFVFQAASVLEETAEQAVFDATLNDGLKEGFASGTAETSRGPFEWAVESLPQDDTLNTVTVAVRWKEGSRPRSLSSRFTLEGRSEK